LGLPSILKPVIKSLIATLVALLVAEAALRSAYFVRSSMVKYVPLPYSLGDDYGPSPPWMDRFHILIHDDTLLWRNMPSVSQTYVDIFSPVSHESDRLALLRRFRPTLPDGFKNNPRWSIRLNSRGDRGGEIADRPEGSAIRIACIGDSWTFGMNVNQDESYPSRLESLLGGAQPGQRFEIINLGVLGYSSLQGLRLLKQRVLDLHPNIVIIGFAMNDSEVAGYRDKDTGGESAPSLLARVAGAARTLESYRLLDYLALSLKFRPHLMVDYLKAEGGGRESGPVNYDELEPWTRVSPRDYDANVREMVRLARADGARVVLLDNELWGDSPYRPVLKQISQELAVPLVDSYRLIEEARKGIERDLEARLRLQSRPPSAPESSAAVRVVFRVTAGEFPVRTRLFIVGPDLQLGALSPNTIAMHDDGADGDQRAGDGVWSYAASFPPGRKVSYVYTNSGRPGQWEGLDVPHIRTVQLPSAHEGGALYLPIETFGRIYMQADNWHTDRVGYDLIARAVAGAVRPVRP
jgi:lysophospholipase L1-like esterase